MSSPLSSPLSSPTTETAPKLLRRNNSDKGSCANLQAHHIPLQFISLRRPDAVLRYTDLDEEYHKRKRRFGTRRYKKRPSQSTRRKRCLKFLPFSFLFKSCKLCFERKSDNSNNKHQIYNSPITPNSTATTTTSVVVAPAAITPHGGANCECPFF
uniref:Uncharacterized protein n=1 Tax=Panagrolaimus davidi TaxID=227884 RepID=A0A914PEM4_9BILA